MAEMFRGENQQKSKARRDRRRLLKLIARQQQSCGRRPGRVEEIEQESKGYLSRLDKKPRAEKCRIYFQNVRTLQMSGDASKGLIAILKAAGVDIVGISKINKNWDIPLVKRRYEKGDKK